MTATAAAQQRPDRRRALQRLLLTSAAAPWALPSALAATASPSAPLLTRAVPSTGEALPLVGLGSWITFNVGRDRAARDGCADVMRAFFDGGGRLIDSSPMYGSSQAVIGDALARLRPTALFAADKVWVSGAAQGESQIEQSRRLWGLPRFQLLQVHNLVDWQTHLPRLLAMKAAGRLGYVGITTSEGRRHAEFEQVLRTQPIDFIQLTYNPLDRAAEQRLLPLALERGVAVIANRPFREGALLQALQHRPLPAWAGELQCDVWAQLVLKYIVSHPAVTCAIPATSRVDHVRQNLGAARGPMPDARLRERIAAHLASL